MNFNHGADVIAADGQNVGQIDRVVLDPRTKEVTHVVVRKGILFTEDKVVPAEMIAEATEEKIALRPAAGDLKDLRDFKVEHYVEVEPPQRAPGASSTYAPPLYWYGPHGLAGPRAYIYPPPPYVVATERNIPEGTVALKDGAKVLSSDNQHVGNVEQVIVDPAAERAMSLIISQGLLFKENKEVPTWWISFVGDDEVQLAVDAEFLEHLQVYRG